MSQNFRSSRGESGVLCASSTNHFSLVTYHRAIAGALPLSSMVSELPKTATGKVQKYVLRGKPAISKQ
jgi:hypothetical protein